MYGRNTGYSRVSLAAWLASSAWAATSALMNGFDASRPWATTSSLGFTAPARIFSKAVSVASASTIMIATSPASVTRPATVRSKTACSSCSTFGNATHWPSMSARRTPAIGPENGTPESWLEADAALIARAS